MSLHKIFVGIDVGYRTHVVCACPGAIFNAKKYPDGWRRSKVLAFSSDAHGFKKLQKYLEKLSTNPTDFLIISEPTGGHYGLSLQVFLLNQGYSVMQVGNNIVGKYRKHVFGLETKTDAMDARLMARMGFLHEWIGEEFSMQPVAFVDPDISVLKGMVQDYYKLGKEIKRRRAQLHIILASTFPELKTFFKSSVTSLSARSLLKAYPTPAHLKEASVAEVELLLHNCRAFKHEKQSKELIELATISSGLPVLSHKVWRQNWILGQLDILDEAQSNLLEQISQIIAKHPYTPIIESLPIKSTIWTAALISVIVSIDRFSNYAQFRAYMGWFPKVSQSGTTIDSGRLAFSGVRMARNVLGQMAMTLLTPTVKETCFRIHYNRLIGRGKRPITAMGHVSGKLASILFHCLKTNTRYDENIHRKQMKLPDC